MDLAKQLEAEIKSLHEENASLRDQLQRQIQSKTVDESKHMDEVKVIANMLQFMQAELQIAQQRIKDLQR